MLETVISVGSYCQNALEMEPLKEQPAGVLSYTSAWV